MCRRLLSLSYLVEKIGLRELQWFAFSPRWVKDPWPESESAILPLNAHTLHHAAKGGNGNALTFGQVAWHPPPAPTVVAHGNDSQSTRA